MREGKLLPPIQKFSNPEPLAYQSSALTTIPHCSLVTCGCERTGGGEERVGGCRINKNRQRIPLSNVEKESMDGSMQSCQRNKPGLARLSRRRAGEKQEAVWVNRKRPRDRYYPILQCLTRVSVLSPIVASL